MAQSGHSLGTVHKDVKVIHTLWQEGISVTLAYRAMDA